MSFRTILLLTVLFILTVSLGVMWRALSSEPAAAPAVPESAANERQVGSAPIRPGSASQLSRGISDSANRDPRAAQLLPAESDTATDNRAARLLPAGPDGANVVVGSSPASEGTPVKPALPVQIRFRHLNDIIQAAIVNVSNEDIAVDVSVLQSGAQTTLDLTPGIPIFFGVRDGLELHPADQVTLRGGEYRELVTTVR